MREPNSLRWFSAGPLNDMLGNLEFLILNQFSYFVESHFYLIWIFRSFHKYSDFESEEERFFVSFVIISLFSFSWEKLAENIIEFHSLQFSSQMVTQSLELTTNPWSLNVSKLKQSFGNWRNLLCVVFAEKGRRTCFSAVVTGLVSFVQRSLMSAIFARSVLTRNYAYFDCAWCHGGLFLILPTLSIDTP